MSFDDAEDVALRRLRRSDTVLIDGTGGCKFERAVLDGKPCIILTHKDLNKTVMITGEVLSGINGWLARFIAILKNNHNKTRH